MSEYLGGSRVEVEKGRAAEDDETCWDAPGVPVDVLNTADVIAAVYEDACAIETSRAAKQCT